MYENFLKRLAQDVYYGSANRNTDHPKCPQCGKKMNFHGGDLDFGDGYWDCSDCGYTFTEEKLNEYLDC